MSVNSVTSGSNAALLGAGSDQSSASRVTQKTLGKDDFMKLLAVQFQMQDPMKPMDDTAFIAQTAQFTSLEQATSMAQDIAALRTEQQRVVANSYLGQTPFLYPVLVVCPLPARVDVFARRRMGPR